MKNEKFDEIITVVKKTLDKNIQEEIEKFEYTELGDYKVINAYLKKHIKLEMMATILVTIEDIAKDLGVGVLVDFLKGSNWEEKH